MIQPKRPSGFNELLPADQLAMNAMISIIKMSYEQYGYAPIETPALELSQVLLAKEGGETAKQVYRFTKGDTDLAMRFDLTIPLARYAAEHFNELAFPFRRYQIQEVWRAEKAQAGRYRQFYQCDIDTLGSKNPMSDADTILTMHSALHALGLKNIIFKISHRGLLNGILESKKLTKSSTEVLRAVDKLDKQGEAAVTNELQKNNLSRKDAKDIIDFVKHSGNVKTIFAYVKSLKINNETFTHSLAELEMICQLLQAGGLSSNEFVIDLSVARGLDYYTGMVFETVLTKNLKLGSICGGGRYDNLLASYHKDSIPGVGASIGLSRLFSALKESFKSMPANPAHVLVVPFEQELAKYSLEVALTLRKHGLNVLVYPGFEKMGKQLGYADKLGISFAVLCGSNEADKKSVTIKNLKTGKQVTVALTKAAATIKKSL